MNVEIDSVEGEWRESAILTDKVTIVPFGGRGEFVTVLSLPKKVSQMPDWARIVEEHALRLTTPGCTATKALAYEFYCKVWLELCGFGY